jgi:hypothetical protein
MDMAAKSSVAAIRVGAASQSAPTTVLCVGRTAVFCDDAMEGQAEEDFKNRESENEGAGREVGSPSTNVKSDPNESLGAFH